MRILLLLVSTGLAVGASIPTVDKKEAESIRYVYAFFRHGIRSPLYDPYPNDPNKSKYHKYFPGPHGELTKSFQSIGSQTYQWVQESGLTHFQKVGFELMYEVGNKLNSRYKEFVGPYERAKVHTSSTNTSRTILTALTVMASLFPPAKPLFKDLPWQPVPVWQDTDDLDKAYLFNDEYFPNLALKTCPKYGRFIRTGNDIVENPDLRKRHHKLYEMLQHFTGISDLNSVFGIYQIWDTLQFESLNGLALPSWATKPEPDYHNKPLYPDVMEPVMLDYFRDTEFLHKNEDMLKFYSGPLFYSIFEHLVEKAANPDLAEKLRFHCTHDSTLFVLLWALRVMQPATVGPGDGILFELHHQNNSDSVQIFYYYSNNHTIQELVTPLCPPPCYLSQFIAAIPSLSPQQWQDKCQP